MTSPARIRVLLIEDHALLREGVAAVLGRQPDMQVVAEAASARDGLIAFRRHQPDVALVDLRLPDRPGAEVIRELARDYPGARLVVLTTYDTPEDAYRAFAAGAAAYLLKGAALNDMVAVIRAVHAGERLIPPGVRDLLTHERLRVDLTARERDVLRLLADGRGNREIARALGISSETVKTYLDRMRAKLDVSDRAALVAKALRLGLIDR